MTIWKMLSTLNSNITEAPECQSSLPKYPFDWWTWHGTCPSAGPVTPSIGDNENNIFLDG